LIETGNEIGEVEGEDEDDEKKGDLAEDTEEEKAILNVSSGMWGVARPYQRFIKFHE
jgi:hypothetical protein